MFITQLVKGSVVALFEAHWYETPNGKGRSMPGTFPFYSLDELVRVHLTVRANDGKSCHSRNWHVSACFGFVAVYWSCETFYIISCVTNDNWTHVNACPNIVDSIFGLLSLNVRAKIILRARIKSMSPRQTRIVKGKPLKVRLYSILFQGNMCTI